MTSQQLRVIQLQLHQEKINIDAQLKEYQQHQKTIMYKYKHDLEGDGSSSGGRLNTPPKHTPHPSRPYTMFWHTFKGTIPT